MSHGAKPLNKLMCDRCWADDSGSRREVFWSQCWLKICGVVVTENGLFLINSRQWMHEGRSFQIPIKCCLHFHPPSAEFVLLTLQLHCPLLFSILLSTRLERGRRDLDVEVCMQGCVSAFYKNLCVCVCQGDIFHHSAVSVIQHLFFHLCAIKLLNSCVLARIFPKRSVTLW